MGKKSRCVKLFLIAGGQMPKRMTEGAIGYDVYIRAIVSALKMDPHQPHLRATVFDFKNIPEDPDVVRHVTVRPGDCEHNLGYRLDPHESVLVGIGFTTEMPFPVFYWVAPRSGLASRYGITVTNAPGTVDPDYRGEAGVLLYNRSDHPFDLEFGMRVAQIIFQEALIPDFIVAADFVDLRESERGPGGFCSTGIH